MKPTNIALIVILIILIGTGYYLATVPTVKPKSTLIIAVKDVPKQSKYGTITSMSLTFSEVSVHKAAVGETINETTEEIIATESNETEAVGWIIVVDEVQTVDLLQLTDVSEVLGQKDLDSGKYTQIRLKIDSGTVTVDGETHDLTIPSKVLKLNRGFELEPDVDLKLILDFNVEDSLVETGKGKFKLKPVIAVISEVVTTTTTTTTMPITTTVVETTTLGETTTTQITTTAPLAAEGVLVMKIKDKLDLTNITAINITIDKVEVHKAGSGDETESNETFETNDTSSAGWEIIVDEPKSYNLLDLVDTPGEVMGEKILPAGKYTQIRLSVSEAKLTLDNETYDVKVPSKRFYWIHPFYIESGKMTTLTLDFDAAESMKETGSNKFILKPVVKIIGEITTTTSITSTTTITNITTTTLNATTTTQPATTTLNATTTIG